MPTSYFFDNAVSSNLFIFLPPAYAGILSRTIRTVMCRLPAGTSVQSVSGSAYNIASLSDTAVSAADTAAYPAFSGRQCGQTG